MRGFQVFYHGVLYKKRLKKLSTGNSNVPPNDPTTAPNLTPKEWIGELILDGEHLLEDWAEWRSELLNSVLRPSGSSGEGSIG